MLKWVLCALFYLWNLHQLKGVKRTTAIVQKREHQRMNHFQKEQDMVWLLQYFSGGNMHVVVDVLTEVEIIVYDDTQAFCFARVHLEVLLESAPII